MLTEQLGESRTTKSELECMDAVTTSRQGKMTSTKTKMAFHATECLPEFKPGPPSPFNLCRTYFPFKRFGRI